MAPCNSRRWTSAYSDGDSAACGDAQNERELTEDKTAASVSVGSINHLLALTHFGLAWTFDRQAAVDRSANLTLIEQEYRASIQAVPNYSRAHYELALIYVVRRSYQDAQNELQKAIQLDNGFARAYADWKTLLDQWPSLSDKQKSDRPLTRTLARDYKNWGDVFTHAGNPDDAADRYCTAARLDPQYKGYCVGAREPADSGAITLLSQPRW